MLSRTTAPNVVLRNSLCRTKAEIQACRETGLEIAKDEKTF